MQAQARIGKASILDGGDPGETVTALEEVFFPLALTILGCPLELPPLPREEAPLIGLKVAFERSRGPFNGVERGDK